MTKIQMKSACCIIGAGYSFVGGLPLTKDLLTYEVVIASKQAERRFQTVWRDYHTWQQKNPSRNPEEYLADLDDSQSNRPIPLFPWAVELVAAVL